MFFLSFNGPKVSIENNKIWEKMLIYLGNPVWDNLIDMLSHCCLNTKLKEKRRKFLD